MLQDVINPPEELSIDGISSPIAAQIFDFCDDDDAAGDFLSETLHNSEAPSSSSTAAASSTTTAGGGSGDGLCCYIDDASFSFDPAAISALLDSNQLPDSDPDNFDRSVIATNGFGGDYSPYCSDALTSVIPVGATQQAVYEEECLAVMAGFGGLEPLPAPPPCGFVEGGGGEYYAMGGYFNGGMMMMMGGTEGVIYGMDSSTTIPRVYTSANDQVMGEYQNLVNGCTGSPAPLPAPDISTLEDSTFKVGRLSVEERKEKIDRYMKKRNERNFSKKIKYACRKTLADSRPRVRGRFAKNEEFGETATRPSSNNHEYDDYGEVVVKEEEDKLNSSDILAHISGVNSFKYNYALESWI